FPSSKISEYVSGGGDICVRWINCKVHSSCIWSNCFCNFLYVIFVDKKMSYCGILYTTWVYDNFAILDWISIYGCVKDCSVCKFLKHIWNAKLFMHKKRSVLIPCQIPIKRH